MTSRVNKFVATTFLTSSSAAYGSTINTGTVQVIKRAVFSNTDTVPHALTVNVVQASGSPTASNQVINPNGRVLLAGETWVSPELVGMQLVAGDQLFMKADAGNAVTVTVSALAVS